MFTNKNVINAKNRCLITIGIGLLFIVLTFIFIGLSIKQDKYDNDNKRYLNDIIEDSSSEEGERSYLNVTAISDAFAVYDDKTDAYYFVSDGKYYYIVYLDLNTFNKLSNSNLKDNPQVLEGTSKIIGSDIKDIAIDWWNEDLAEGEEPLNDSSFYNYFGGYYLNTTATYSETTGMYNAFCFIFGITGLTVTLVGLIKFIKYTSSIKKLSDMEIQELESEMSNGDSFYYPNTKLYLTPKYIIMLDGRFKFYKYSDILWMYPFEQRYNGVRTNKAIKILTKDAKTTMLANLPLATKTQKAVYDEIWDTIFSKNQAMKLGYTNENIKYFNGVIKEIKNNKKNGI